MVDQTPNIEKKLELNSLSFSDGWTPLQSNNKNKKKKQKLIKDYNGTCDASGLYFNF